MTCNDYSTPLHKDGASTSTHPREVNKLPVLVTALRSLLRFLHLTAVTTDSLVTAVPSVASWRLAGLSRGLAAAQEGWRPPRYASYWTPATGAPP
jgi:hypothetical protein